MKQKTAAIIALFLTLAALCGCRLFRLPGASPTPPNGSPGATPAPSGQSLKQGAAADSVPPDDLAMITPESDETPAPTLKTNAGEIPEAQEFMNYTSTTGGYDVQVPENWTPTAHGGNIKFTRNYNGIQVEITGTTEQFSLEAIKSGHVAQLVKKGRAVKVRNVTMADTKSGRAVMVEYESNSEPVNGKKIRLENKRYYFHKDGKLAVLTLWAPVGADNENIWKQIPDTFIWR